MKIGGCIKEIREKFCLSQGQLAKIMNVNLEEIENLEDEVVELSDEIKVALKEIFDLDELQIVKNEKSNMEFMKINRRYRIDFYYIVNEIYKDFKFYYLEKTDYMFFASSVATLLFFLGGIIYGFPQGAMPPMFCGYTDYDQHTFANDKPKCYLLKKKGKSFLVSFTGGEMCIQIINCKTRGLGFKYGSFYYKKMFIRSASNSSVVASNKCLKKSSKNKKYNVNKEAVQNIIKVLENSQGYIENEEKGYIEYDDRVLKLFRCVSFYKKDYNKRIKKIIYKNINKLNINETIQYLTFIYRRDRVFEGHIKLYIDNGILLDLLKHLIDIC